MEVKASFQERHLKRKQRTELTCHTQSAKQVKQTHAVEVSVLVNGATVLKQDLAATKKQVCDLEHLSVCRLETVLSLEDVIFFFARQP